MQLPYVIVLHYSEMNYDVIQFPVQKHLGKLFQVVLWYVSVHQFGGGELLMEEVTAEMMKQQMTDAEWNKVYEMSRDRSLYQNLVDSLFPSIHGNDEVKRGQYLQ